MSFKRSPHYPVVLKFLTFNFSASEHDIKVLHVVNGTQVYLHGVMILYANDDVIALKCHNKEMKELFQKYHYTQYYQIYHSAKVQQQPTLKSYTRETIRVKSPVIASKPAYEIYKVPLINLIKRERSSFLTEYVALIHQAINTKLCQPKYSKLTPITHSALLSRNLSKQLKKCGYSHLEDIQASNGACPFEIFEQLRSKRLPIPKNALEQLYKASYSQLKLTPNDISQIRHYSRNHLSNVHHGEQIERTNKIRI